jgi:hypothetical protein
MSLEDIVGVVVDREKAARKEMQSRITSIIDEKVFSLSLALAKEKKAREEDENQFYNEVQDELHNLREEIEIEKSITEENSGIPQTLTFRKTHTKTFRRNWRFS